MTEQVEENSGSCQRAVLHSLRVQFLTTFSLGGNDERANQKHQDNRRNQEDGGHHMEQEDTGVSTQPELVT